MKPFDDALPEEREPQQQELLPLLQQLYPHPAPLTSDEQAQAIARVRAHLLQAETTMRETSDDGTGPALVDLSAQTPSLTGKLHRRRQIVSILNTLAAVLVVGAIIIASVLLFAHRSPAPPVAGPAIPTSSPIVVQTQDNHLTVSLTVTGGPYFLGEMIEADISLTNHSRTTYLMQGVPAANPCEQALGVGTAGGGAPHVPPPPLGVMSCPFISTQFHPAQTIAIHQYIALTDSGKIILTAGASFLSETTNGQGVKNITNGSDPLKGHWPSLTINVSPHVPTGRQLSFQLQGTHVIVSGPSWALAHLLYLYTVNCQDFHDQGGTGTGNFMWEHLSTNTAGLPGCPGKNLHWNFAFAAVGYTMVVGHYPA